MKSIRRFADWLRDYPWVATAFFAGAILGLLICLPLLPYELPESSANVIGAALGAVFAVWGAAWVADLKERKHQQYLVRAIESTIQPTLLRVEQFGANLERVGREWDEVTSRDERVTRIQSLLPESVLVLERLGELERRLDFLVPLFLQLGGHGAIAHGQLIKTGPLLRQSLNTLSWGSFYDEFEVLRSDTATFTRDTRRAIRAARKAIALLNRFADPHLPAEGDDG
jgi:hypothetical protein